MVDAQGKMLIISLFCARIKNGRRKFILYAGQNVVIGFLLNECQKGKRFGLHECQKIDIGIIFMNVKKGKHKFDLHDYQKCRHRFRLQECQKDRYRFRLNHNQTGRINVVFTKVEKVFKDLVGSRFEKVVILLVRT